MRKANTFFGVAVAMFLIATGAVHAQGLLLGRARPVAVDQPIAVDQPVAAPQPIAVSQPEAVQPTPPPEPIGKPAEVSKEVKATEAIVADYLKREAEKKKKADEDKKLEAQAKKEYDLYGGTRFSLQELYDSLSVPKEGEKKWYEKLSLKGYTQIRFHRTLETRQNTPNLFGDRGINGSAEGFFVRRARMILSGDVSEHLYIYTQNDFASTPQGATTSVLFTQLRDLYADVYVDTTKVNRFRVGLSKVPYGWETLQSSQNRLPLDRTDAINTGVAPNERDLGIFYYWTPEEYQKLFSTLVRGGMKGSNNFGIFAFGVYDGQGGAVPEFNLNLHMVSRFTLPVQLPNGQIVEGSIQGYTGDYVVQGSAIRPLGKAVSVATPTATPTGTGGNKGLLDQRVAATFVWFPQPFGMQAEWQVGNGPGLSEDQKSVVVRALSGGYVMGMYRHETSHLGIFTPYVRYQQFTGGYRNIANAPFGHQRQTDFGVEWQVRKELEVVLEYSMVNSPNFTALTAANQVSYRDFEGSTLRMQIQFNY